MPRRRALCLLLLTAARFACVLLGRVGTVPLVAGALAMARSTLPWRRLWGLCRLCVVCVSSVPRCGHGGLSVRGSYDESDKSVQEPPLSYVAVTVSHPASFWLCI